MKTLLLPAGLVLVMAAPWVHADADGRQTGDPCISVNIQNDRVNYASVEQNCDRNISRTVQAGEQNWSQTIQQGEVNDNKVRQYQYNRSQYFQRLRERR